MFEVNFRIFALNYSDNVGKYFPQFKKNSASTAHVLARFLMSGLPNPTSWLTMISPRINNNNDNPHKNKSTSRAHNQNRRQPKWKTIKMEDDQNVFLSSPGFWSRWIEIRLHIENQLH